MLNNLNPLPVEHQVIAQFWRTLGTRPALLVLLMLAGAGMLALAAVRIARRWKERRALIGRRRMLRGRAKSSLREWHAEYFQPLGLSYGPSVAIARTLAQHFGCDPTCLRPEDRVDSHLQYRGISSVNSGDAEERGVADELGQACDSSSRASSSTAEDSQPTVATLILWCQDPRTIPPGCCRKCRYDLRGNTSGRCPECGSEIVPNSGGDHA